MERSQMTESEVEAFYNVSYREAGITAQRRYPNEEMLRFLGKNFSGVPVAAKRDIKVLEVGCGSGANLWALSREGFSTHGLDISKEALHLCGQVLEGWGASAELKLGNMEELPYDDRSFDLIVDVFSSNCLHERAFNKFLGETGRILKQGGRLFSYHPSKKSDAFIDPGPAKKIDESTLDGIHRPDSPYYGNYHPFHFTSPDEYAEQLSKHGLQATYVEVVGRTYNSTKEYFEFVTIVGEKS